MNYYKLFNFFSTLDFISSFINRLFAKSLATASFTALHVFSEGPIVTIFAQNQIWHLCQGDLIRSDQYCLFKLQGIASSFFKGLPGGFFA